MPQQTGFLKKAFHYESAILDSTKAGKLNEIAYRYLTLKDTVSFKKVNNVAYQFAKKYRDSISLANIHWDYASYYLNKKVVYDSAYYHYNKAYEYFSGLHKSGDAAQMLYNMSLIRGKYRDYAGSEVLIIKSIKLYRDLEDFPSLYACYNHLALLQKDIKEYGSAIKYHKMAMGYLNEIPNNKKYRYASLNNLGTVYMAEGAYKKAMENFKAILKDDNLKKENSAHYARVLDNLSYCKLLMKDTAGIKKDFYHALKIREDHENLGGIVVSKIHLSDYFAYKSDTLMAVHNALEANKISRQIKNSSKYLQTLSMLSLLDKENTGNYLREYISYNDSLQQVERKVQNKFARIEFETDKYVERTQELSAQKIKILIIGLVLVVIISLIFYAFIQRAKHKNLLLEQENHQAQSQLNLLTIESQKIIERQKINEQNRISEEIHDNILGRLFGIRFGLGFLKYEKNGDTKSRKEMLLRELQKVELELRDLSHQLNANFDNFPLDFSSLVEEQLKKNSLLGHYAYQLNIEQGIDWESIEGSVKLTIFRILQESLQNILKYAQATKVVIFISKTQKGLEVTIEDNGVGFDLLKEKQGIGLKNMKSRMKKIGGELTINTQTGKGTRIHFYLRINNNVDYERD